MCFRRLFVSSKYNGHKLQRLLPQRWTGHVASVEVIYTNYSDIVQVLFEVTAANVDEYAESEGLLNRITTKSFAKSLILMNRMLSLLKPPNFYFEKVLTDIVSSLKLIDATCRFLEIIKSKDSCNQIDVDAQLLLISNDVTPETGSIPKRTRKIPQNLTDSIILYGDGLIAASNTNELNDFEKHFEAIIESAVNTSIAEIRSRFSEKSLDFIHAAFKLLSKRTRDIVSCNIYASLLADSSVINNIESELMVLHNGVLNDNYYSLSELSKHFKPLRYAFPCFAIVIDIALSLPTSTARAESCFSTLTSVLRPQRLSMEFSKNLI